MNIDPEFVWKDVAAIGDSQPLVHNITNFVVMNTTANALLAIGASPVMAHAQEEVEEMVSLAGALVINIGTLNKGWIRSMEMAAIRAAKLGIPVVLDPVGAGATAYRTETARHLIKVVKPALIRGNASEILALCNTGIKTRGVDSLADSNDALEAAKELAGQIDGVVVVSGETDFIIDQVKQISVLGGDPLMPRVTGLGCTASALCGAFLAINKDYFKAAAHAMAVMKAAGSLAGETARGPGSFQIAFLDVLHNLNKKRLFRLMGEDA